MNTDTNQIIQVPDGQDPPEGYTRIPVDLDAAVKALLKGKTAARVSRTSGGKLSKWAVQQRKAKRRASQKARRVTRRK